MNKKTKAERKQEASDTMSVLLGVMLMLGISVGGGYVLIKADQAYQNSHNTKISLLDYAVDQATY
ncbi:MAG: hypothetical protein J5608_00955 [Alphaproteobacteria bacterium]|nr:hypothetical protein [Alphaproteobacteria bacterium]